MSVSRVQTLEAHRKCTGSVQSALDLTLDHNRRLAETQIVLIASLLRAMMRCGHCTASSTGSDAARTNMGLILQV